MIFALVGGLVYLGFATLGDDSEPVPLPPKAAPRVLEIGQEGINEGVTFVVNRFECAGKEVGRPPTTARALGRYCVLDLKARNAGTMPAGFLGQGQYLLDEAGSSYGVDLPASFANSPGNRMAIAGQNLNPGQEIQAVLFFDVPEAVTPVEAELHGGIGGIQQPGRRGPRSRGLRVRLAGAT